MALFGLVFLCETLQPIIHIISQFDIFLEIKLFFIYIIIK